MKKTFILDTNVLLTQPDSIFQFEDNDVVIPISVIEELDRFKKEMSETGRNAREFARLLDSLRERGKLCDGVHLREGRPGNLVVYLGLEIVPEHLEKSVDNQILAVASTFHRKGPTVLVTRDANLRIKADAFGIESHDFQGHRIETDDSYAGVREIQLDDLEIESFLKRPHKNLDLHPNEFVVIAGEYHQELCRFDPHSYKLKRIHLPRDVWGIKPRNSEQLMALSALLDDRIKLVTMSGAAGTGKTLLAIAAGLFKTTDDAAYKKLVVARPIFPMGRDIGFLPGDLTEKLTPWMQPIFDNLETLLGPKSSYQELINQGLLQVEPLTYIRGRSMPNIFFVVDEAQNLTPHEVKTILTRAGEGTKIILTGDPEQIDSPHLDALNNGLSHVIEKFKDEPIAAHIQLVKGERSELATIASKLL
jgi:PhoH-like ATPase